MNICEFLGLKPYKEFKVEGESYKYRFNEADRLEYYSSSFGKWRFCSNIEILSKILHDSDLIEVVSGKDEIGMSFHDVVVLNGLNKMSGSKIVKIERNVKNADGKVRFVLENGESLEVFYYNVKMDFLEDFDCDVFEVEYLEGEFIRVWGC